MLTETELLENNFPSGEHFLQATRPAGPNDSYMVSLDCEMVKCESGIELARVTIIDSAFEVIYDKLVKPKTAVVDYLTQYSGITEEDLRDITLTAEEAQQAVLELITKDTIICGHSLENDLFYLKICHSKIIDTSVLFPHSAAGFKHSLKYLTVKYLNRFIQKV